jgi:peroxisomal coenzyme A diphosphatase NUDT7
VYPFAGILPDKTPLAIDKNEVAEVFAVPLKDLLNMAPVVGKVDIGTQQELGFPTQWAYGFQEGWNVRTAYEVFFYPWKGRIIWGITARVLHQFLERVRTLKEFPGKAE